MSLQSAWQPGRLLSEAAEAALRDENTGVVHERCRIPWLYWEKEFECRLEIWKFNGETGQFDNDAPWKLAYMKPKLGKWKCRPPEILGNLREVHWKVPKHEWPCYVTWKP